jgi:hypothetical protein
MAEHYTNKASGHARVGAQISVAHGEVSVTSEPPRPLDAFDIVAALADLRALFEDAERRGEVDVELRQAAVASLEAAERAAREPHESKKERIVKALAMFETALGGVSGISKAIASIVTSVKGMAQ